jgi:hypothetical protein
MEPLSRERGGPDFKAQCNNRTLEAQAIPVILAEAQVAEVRRDPPPDLYQHQQQQQHPPAAQRYVVETATTTAPNPDGSVRVITETTYSDGSKSRTEEVVTDPPQHRSIASASSEGQGGAGSFGNSDGNRCAPSSTAGDSSTIQQQQQRSEDASNGPNHSLTLTSAGTTTEPKTRSRFHLVLATFVLACLLIAVGLAVGLGVGLSSKDKGSNSTASTLGSTADRSSSSGNNSNSDGSAVKVCTLCYGGAPPADPDRTFYPGTACGDTTTTRFLNDQDECYAVNVQGYYACGCPELPPPRQKAPLCSLCPDGTFPPPNADTLVNYANLVGTDVDYWPNLYRGITCEVQALELGYSNPNTENIPFTSCKEYQNMIAAFCGCPGATPSPSPPPTPSNACTLCYGGAEPADPSRPYSPGLYSSTCEDTALYYLGSYQKDDDECHSTNAQAYFACGCPELPPFRAQPICNLCAGGGPPPKLDAIINFTYDGIFRNITCESQAVQLSYEQPTATWVPFTTCKGFQNEFGETCGCVSANSTGSAA